MDTDRVNVLPAWPRDTTDASIDGRRTAWVYPEFNPEQQSGERQLVTSERIEREATTKESRESSKSGATPDVEGATDQECGNLKLQEEHGGQVPQTQSHGLEHGTKSQEGLLP